jgi:hypothetical protein
MRNDTYRTLITKLVMSDAIQFLVALSGVLLPFVARADDYLRGYVQAILDGQSK